MPSDIKLTSDKGDMQKRINDRLKNSGAGANPNVSVQKGEGPTRTHTNIHHSAGVHGTTRQNRDGDGR
jgi:hypothetical protein